MFNQKKSRSRVLLWFTLVSVSLILYSCLDEIELPIESDLNDAIVIEGSLSMGNPSVVSIGITRLFDFSASSLQPVNVREVLLLDEQDNSVALKEAGPGNYRLVIDDKVNFTVAIGKEYRLQVSTFDNRKIISTAEPILATPEPGAVDVSLFKKDRLNDEGQIVQDDYLAFSIEASITSSSDGHEARYFWALEQTFLITDSPDRKIEDGKDCYITQPIDVTSVNILDGNQFSGTDQVSALIYETPVNYYFAQGYYLTVVQHSLSEGAYRYWNQVSQVIDRTGNMFEAPAGRIKSNFVNLDDGQASPNVFGYFYASQSDTTRFYVSPEAAGSPSMYCPWPVNQIPPPNGCPRFPCCECLDEIGSQLEKPDFWDQ
ncbi:MAG: DUF4249 family protein [Saprospiraceae bacterium]|nr:DUF4249 family protein [Saprospiraceae bacterium]